MLEYEDILAKIAALEIMVRINMSERQVDPPGGVDYPGAAAMQQVGGGTIKILECESSSVSDVDPVDSSDSSDSESPRSFSVNRAKDKTVRIHKVHNAKITLENDDSSSIGSFTVNQREDARIKIPTSSLSGSLSFIGDIQYDVSSHQLQKRVDTLDLRTGQITIGNFTMITGGQATSHA